MICPEDPSHNSADDGPAYSLGRSSRWVLQSGLPVQHGAAVLAGPEDQHETQTQLQLLWALWRSFVGCSAELSIGTVRTRGPPSIVASCQGFTDSGLARIRVRVHARGPCCFCCVLFVESNVAHVHVECDVAIRDLISLHKTTQKLDGT